MPTPTLADHIIHFLNSKEEKICRPAEVVNYFETNWPDTDYGITIEKVLEAVKASPDLAYVLGYIRFMPKGKKPDPAGKRLNMHYTAEDD